MLLVSSGAENKLGMGWPALAMGPGDKGNPVYWILTWWMVELNLPSPEFD